jgi:hypothetical protein
VRTIVTSPEFFSHAAYRAKAKTPLELEASTLRVMNATPDTGAYIGQIPLTLGQPLWARPTPDGWPDTREAWINTGALAKRINFALAAAAGGVPGLRVERWGPFERLLGLDAAAQIDGVVGELLAGDASPETRAALARVPAAGPDRPSQVRRLTDLVGLALGSPEFQRR